MKKGLKIAMLIDGWEPIFGGGQVHTKQLCESLVGNHNCKIDLFVRKLKANNGKKYNKSENLINGKFRIFRIGPTTKFFNLFGRLASLLNTTFYLFFKAIKEKYDIIHAHAYISGVPAKIVGFLLGVPVVYTVHGANNLDVNKKGFLSKIERWLLTGIKYDLEISVGSDFLKYKNINKNIKIIPNGIDIDKFNSIKNIKKYDGINFLWVGRFSWEKGLEYLIKGIGLIDKKILKDRGFVLNLVGEGEDKEKIIKLVNNLGLKNCVNFKGKLFGDELIKEYKKNDIFILSSLTEGFGIVLLEAMISGLITISTKCGGPEDIITDKKNGFLIEKGNELEIKKIVENMLNVDILELDYISKNAIKLVERNYSNDKLISEVYEEYIMLIKKYRVLTL